MSHNLIVLNCYNGSYIPTHPQYQYLIDGLPAKTCGEWPGIKPNHFERESQSDPPLSDAKNIR